MSNSLAIKVENVSKMYRLGQLGTGTLSHDLKRWWALRNGKEDPYLKVGSVNNRTIKSDTSYSYALRDISFDVNKGEVLGVVGNNGAGKSTLLKILSRVTTPSTGTVKLQGRIASLLEVGTGFHPEMTGKENIYMNGAILGMTRKEISRKFDDIVEFAGVERYVDTPVKRYSSGMYVRLAFAVAAHLESETLIVDEVLAVGDFEFQKKCLNKMNSIAKNDGRTVLFVSHNLAAVSNLCTKAISLQYGQVKMIGEVDDVITDYLKKGETESVVSWSLDPNEYPKKKNAFVKSAHFRSEFSDSIRMNQDLVFDVNIFLREAIPSLKVNVTIYNSDEKLIATAYNTDYPNIVDYAPGDNSTVIRILSPNLLPGEYYAGFSLRQRYGYEIFDTVRFPIKFTVVVNDVTGVGVSFNSDRGLMWFNALFTNESQHQKPSTL